MAPLPKTLTFTAWQRSRLFERAEEKDGRLEGNVSLTLTDTNTGESITDDIRFKLMAAGEVAGLKPDAIKHMAPAPFARDAETTKLVHIDLKEYDLPWRYTPRREEDHPVLGVPDNNVLRPWMVLLVGTVDELKVEGGVVTFVADSVLAAHNLNESHLWAHTQWDGTTTISRLVSPRGLEDIGGGKRAGLVPQREYLAVVVKAFNESGQPMWTAPANRQFGKKGVLQALHFWRFWTTEAGDFETLAAALRLPPARDVGKAKLHYRRDIPEDGVNIDATLEVRGAITSLQQLETPQPELIDAVQADLDLLNDALPPDEIGRKVITMPQYGRPWLPNPDDFANGWPHDLNDDPRFRSTTGLGVWMGVEGQEALMDAAVAQAGALREAGQRIGFMALGLLAAGGLWDRRMPTDQNERLRLLGPLMARMLATGGGVVLDRVTGSTSPLAPGVFSSAAQRMVRDRSSATRHVVDAGGGINRSAALDQLNQPAPQPERAPAGLPHADAVARALGLPTVEELFDLDDRWLDEAMQKLDELVRVFVEQYEAELNALIAAGAADQLDGVRQQLAEPFFAELLNTLQDLLADRQLPCEAGMLFEQFGQETGTQMAIFLRQVLAEVDAQQELYDWLRRAIRQCMARRRCEDLMGHQPEGSMSCNDLLDNLPPEPAPDQHPIDLGRLSDTLFGALDPRKPDAPGRRRLCSMLVGVDCSRLIPPEFPIGLDFPTWTLLKKYDMEWLLPGASSLSKDSITALQTNPTFVDGFMVGINTQFMSEMRWRDLAVARTCTPLRMFWGQVDYTTHKREPDIQPLAEWAKTPSDPVGALSHQSIQPDDLGNTTGSRLVVVFRSDLFRRYPSTLVYLVKPDPNVHTDEPPNDPETPLNNLLKSPPALDMPDDEADSEQWRRERRFFGPVFSGTLTPELTFFTFDVTPSEVDQYWLMLDEPPTELRFRNDQPLNKANAATFADSIIDKPTRVAFNGAELERQGLNG